MDGDITPLITTIIGTGVALATLIIGLVAWIRADMRRMEDRIKEDAAEHRREIKEDIAEHRKETGELRERMAHLEGLLEGLREAIVSRAAA